MAREDESRAGEGVLPKTLERLIVVDRERRREKFSPYTKIILDSAEFMD